MNKPRIILSALAFIAIAANATLKLPSILGSEMVLQQSSKLTIKGTATANAYIRVKATWDNTDFIDTIDANGNFTVTLDIPAVNAENPSEKYTLSIYELKKWGTGYRSLDVKVFSNVQIGEVWLCSGQSNMQMPVDNLWGYGGINNYAEEIQNANYPMIKLFRVTATGKYNHPADDIPVEAGWCACSPSTVGTFSALGYLFGRKLNTELNIPIGLIESAYGGSSAEAWVSYETIKNFPYFKNILTNCEKYDFNRDSLSKYCGYKNEFQIPTLLYNSMIYPLISFPMRGVIWYQGEANAYSQTYYTALMDSLISSWRKDWGINLSFYTVQLAGYYDQVTVQPASNWAKLRWQQWKTAQEMENSGIATAVDIGNQENIHPKNKQEVARRLALLALKNTYGKDVVAEAPVPVKYDFMYKKAKITFNKKIHVRNDSIPAGFLFQDRSYGSFYEGTATLLNDTTIEVSVTRPVRPKAVYYNWADYPIGNIYGENDLPVLPFRTDEMDLINDISEVKAASTNSPQSVYTTDGMLIRENVGDGKATDNLPKGIYIIGDKKKLVK
jgi:sialate O-acetylesterase